MTQTAYQTPTYLLEKLGVALHSQQSGTFFVATSDNTSCRFAVLQGRITHCSYQRLHGMEALQAFASIAAGRCSFSLNPYPFRPHDSVEHTQAIALLGIKPGSPRPVPAPPVEAVRKESPQTAPTPKVTPKVKNQFYRGYVMAE